MQTLSESPRNTRMVSRLIEAVDRLLKSAAEGTYTVGWEFKEGTIMVVSEESSVGECKSNGHFADTYKFADLLRPRIIGAIDENNKQAFAHNFYGRCEVSWTVGEVPEVTRILRRTQT